MTKIAAEETTRNKKVRYAKRAFYASLFDLSWRLSAAILLPIFAGLYIDSLQNGGQTFAYIGFIIGMISGVFVLRGVVKRLSK